MVKTTGKIAVRLCALIVPFFILTSVIMRTIPMRVYDGEYGMWEANRQYVNESGEYNRIIIIGDSRAKAGYIPDQLSDDVYNLALGGTTPVEHYYYLKEYLENHPRPEYAFISFCAPALVTAETFWTRSVYFHRLSLEDTREIIKTAQGYQDAGIIAVGKPDLELIQYLTYSVTKYGKTCLNVMSPRRYDNNTRIYEAVTEKRGQTQYGTEEYCDELTYEAAFDGFEPGGMTDAYFRRLIQLCLQNEISVIIEQVPVNIATYGVCNGNFFEEYATYLEGLKEEFPEITVENRVWAFPNEYFGDSSHLNERGAMAFSDYIHDKYEYIW